MTARGHDTIADRRVDMGAINGRPISVTPGGELYQGYHLAILKDGESAWGPTPEAAVTNLRRRYEERYLKTGGAELPQRETER